MGFTLDAAGTPIIAATPTQTVADMQAIVAFAKKYANIRVGTAAERSGLAPAEVWEGLVFYETDTDITYQAASTSAWRILNMPLRTWTPTVTGLTLGNGVLRTTYMMRDSVVEFFIEMESGTTTVATGTVGFTIPAPIANDTMHRHVGDGYFRYTGSANAWPVQPRIAGGNVINVNMLDASGTLLALGSNLSNTTPSGSAWSGATLRPTLYLHGTYQGA